MGDPRDAPDYWPAWIPTSFRRRQGSAPAYPHVQAREAVTCRFRLPAPAAGAGALAPGAAPPGSVAPLSAGAARAAATPPGEAEIDRIRPLS